jgi:hypothetical protein
MRMGSVWGGEENQIGGLGGVEILKRAPRQDCEKDRNDRAKAGPYIGWRLAGAPQMRRLIFRSAPEGSRIAVWLLWNC